MPQAKTKSGLKTYRISVGMKSSFRDPAGQDVRHQLKDDLGIEVDDVRAINVYTIHADITGDEIEQVRTELFTDPIIQDSTVDALYTDDYDFLIEVGFLPGVTDNVGKSSAEGIEDVLGRSFSDDEAVYSSIQYAVKGSLTEEQCDGFTCDLLANALIQHWTIHRADESKPFESLEIPIVTDISDTEVHAIDLAISDDALMAISRDNTLALELNEMKAIQAYYESSKTIAERQTLGLPETATDIEIEILAQTWSEHCKHKIFAATIEYTDEDSNTRIIDGLFKNYVKATTDIVGEKVDWLVSVFDDNAGIVRFDDDYNFSLKAETHNSPSALDPYGGAMTGIVGVNRDIMGAGMGCRCIFNTDVFCVASPYYEGDIPARLLHPKRVLRGVHAGVRDGGNESGIPNVNGAIVFHDRFLGKPLVFCGTGGLIPRLVAGKPSEDKKASPGDYIVMTGGRIGKDGIHGATFSSEELHEGSPATAVQIGDPITQKKMSDFIMEARDQGLFSCITDNGAGGLSSSIGEMARDSDGCEVHLDRAPLKYAGLAPWEIFLSEAQERMTLAVRPEKLPQLQKLAELREVEISRIGTFTDSGRLECFYEGTRIGSLSMEFLHKGVPTMQLKAKLSPVAPKPVTISTDIDYNDALKAVLGSLNVCSKESFVRMYDHEVQGQSVLKQFQGIEADGPGDASVIRPVAGSKKGIAIACGITPKYSDLDAYWMMAAAIDETVRNLVCVGAKLGTIAGLDNFCWPDPVESEKTPDGRHKLAQLVRCCEALKDVCVAYDIPLISGKDSMKNDYKIGDTKISIPPTVLFTASAIIEDVTKTISMDAKQAGDIVYVLGETLDEMGGSEYLALQGELGANVPRVDAARARERYEALHEAIQSGWVASCHDCSDGGLGTALAETAGAGRLGMELDITGINVENSVIALFSESQSRLVVTVSPQRAESFEAQMSATHFVKLGVVTQEPVLRISDRATVLVESSLDELNTAWKNTLNW
ncbi:MAG: phosphoribosylformylglycinamidine synthase subunit PurS [Candidatus Hydrogenedentota bacterium]